MGGENLSCAVDHVIRWATTVMTAVEKIQWRPLGTCSVRISSLLTSRFNRWVSVFDEAFTVCPQFPRHFPLILSFLPISLLIS